MLMLVQLITFRVISVSLWTLVVARDVIPSTTNFQERGRDGWTAATSTPPSATTFEELVLESPSGAYPGLRGRSGREDDVTTTSTPSPNDERPFRPRPNYFMTVTVPYTVSMLIGLVLFLWVMRTDGAVYRALTHNYMAPAARQQQAEELRRLRLEETERNAKDAWESERARWVSQTNLETQSTQRDSSRDNVKKTDADSPGSVEEPSRASSRLRTSRDRDRVTRRRGQTHVVDTQLA